jgi:hypothetical protein
MGYPQLSITGTLQSRELEVQVSLAKCQSNLSSPLQSKRPYDAKLICKVKGLPSLSSINSILVDGM